MDQGQGKQGSDEISLKDALTKNQPIQKVLGNKPYIEIQIDPIESSIKSKIYIKFARHEGLCQVIKILPDIHAFRKTPLLLG